MLGGWKIGNMVPGIYAGYNNVDNAAAQAVIYGTEPAVCRDVDTRGAQLVSPSLLRETHQRAAPNGEQRLVYSACNHIGLSCHLASPASLHPA